MFRNTINIIHCYNIFPKERNNGCVSENVSYSQNSYVYHFMCLLSDMTAMEQVKLNNNQ